MVFTLAMVEQPHVWKRAQVEIDAIVGVSEWRPVGPIGIPHETTESNVYNCYIPKGATILRNVWVISCDPVRYPDPEKFTPERSLNAEGMLTDDDSAQCIFGFGRRVCPRQHTVDMSLWSGIATMLARLDFNYTKDMNRNDITFTVTFTNGVTIHPNPFPCVLTSRAHITKEYLEHVLSK